MLRIGDFSRLSNVSIKALRFYDEIGLLRPSFVDRATGYRYYATNLLSRLNRILALKELGFSLEEIGSLMRDGLPAGEVRTALENRRAELSSQIALDRARLARVDTLLGQLDANGAPEFQIRVKQIPTQLVASLRNRIDCYEQADELFAEVARHLGTHRVSGQQAAIWHSCAGQGNRIDCEALVFLKQPIPDGKLVKIRQTPAITSASIIHQGTDETAEAAYSALRSWIKANDYAIAGPNREMYWLGNVVNPGGSGVTEIQYPIRSVHKSGHH